MTEEDAIIPDDILERIEKILEERVGAGDYKGAGDHLGNIQLNVISITPKRRSGGGWLAECHYEKVVETEFTIYPDNPPYVSSYHSVFEVTELGEIIER